MFDPKCYELANDFLEDEPTINNGQNAARLAQVIQDAIESELADMRIELSIDNEG